MACLLRNWCSELTLCSYTFKDIHGLSWRYYSLLWTQNACNVSYTATLAALLGFHLKNGVPPAKNGAATATITIKPERYTHTWSKTILRHPSWWALPASWGVKRMELGPWWELNRNILTCCLMTTVYPGINFQLLKKWFFDHKICFYYSVTLALWVILQYQKNTWFDHVVSMATQPHCIN